MTEPQKTLLYFLKSKQAKLQETENKPHPASPGNFL